MSFRCIACAGVFSGPWDDDCPNCGAKQNAPCKVCHSHRFVCPRHKSGCEGDYEPSASPEAGLVKCVARTPCPACRPARPEPEALSVKVKGITITGVNADRRSLMEAIQSYVFDHRHNVWPSGAHRECSCTLCRALREAQRNGP
jgi:excinuclease UvrABC ATPase subunit